MDSSPPNKQQFTFPPSHRLRSARDFNSLRNGARKAHSKHLTVIFKENPQGITRIGIVISKKIHKHAVERNLFKRRVREIFRMCQGDFTRSLDLMVIAKSDASQCSFIELKRQFLGILVFNKLIKEAKVEKDLQR